MFSPNFERSRENVFHNDNNYTYIIITTGAYEPPKAAKESVTTAWVRVPSKYKSLASMISILGKRASISHLRDVIHCTWNVCDMTLCAASAV